MTESLEVMSLRMRHRLSLPQDIETVMRGKETSPQYAQLAYEHVQQLTLRTLTKVD